MEATDLLDLLPRGLRRLVGLAFVLGLLVAPTPTHALFWSIVRSKEHSFASIFERGLEGTLRQGSHKRHCEKSTAKC